MILRDILREQIISLLPVFNLENQKGSILDIYDLITRESLYVDINQPLPRFSVINSDGMPFEFSVSVGSSNGGLRLLTETGIPGTSLPARINLTAVRLSKLLDLTGTKAASGDINTAFRILFPYDPVLLNGWRGGAWIAAAFLPDGKTGLRIYVNGSDGEINERWDRPLKLLSALRSNTVAERLAQCCTFLREYAVPMGTAVDIIPGRIGKIKLYTRTFRITGDLVPMILRSSGLSSFESHWVSFSKQLLVEKSGFPDGSLVISFEFPIKENSRPDLKIDVCSHCLFSNDRNAERALNALADEWKFDIGQYHAVLSMLSDDNVSNTSLDHHSFVGLGLDHDGGKRLNIYLKPSLKVFRKAQQKMTPSSAAVYKGSFQYSSGVGKSLKDNDPEQSITRALRFLIDRQSPGGYWLDFNLPVGPSDAWVTAYAGLIISHLPRDLTTNQVRNAVDCAAGWLAKAIQIDYGWGYNSYTGSDADSTAYSILFLRAAGRNVPDGSYKLLSSFRKEDGGFATYRIDDNQNSWGISHADVTPVVLQTLIETSNIGSADLLASQRFLQSQQEKSGQWKSFWWRSDLYSTSVNLKLFGELGWRYRKGTCLRSLTGLPVPDDPFELALLLKCLTYLAGNKITGISLANLALSKLLDLQTTDGGWIADKILRLTSNTLKDQVNKEYTGDYYSDICNVFTTSTVIDCLRFFLKQRTPEPAALKSQILQPANPER